MAALTQLISVSSPREGQARVGQRCIASPSGLTIFASQSGQRFGIFQGFVATYLSSQLLDVLTYSLLLVVMLTFPRGLFGTKQVARV